MNTHDVYMVNKTNKPQAGWWSIHTLEGIYQNVKCMSIAQKYECCTGM